MKRRLAALGVAGLWAGALLLAACDSGPARTGKHIAEATGRSIGRMKVSIMPEYDDPSVLVVYDGRYAEATGYPLRTRFFIPRGSIISDACSLSHEGQHFCQLYQTVPSGEYDEVSLVLPYPNFYLSFHTPRFDPGVERKDWVYRLKLNNAVRTLDVDVQQPLRSEDFQVRPPAGAAPLRAEEAGSLIRGFAHQAFRMEDLTALQELEFGVRYRKADPQPSVDIKYTTAAMRDPQNVTRSYDTQRQVKWVVYGVFGSGVLVVLGLMGWFFWRRKGAAGGAP